MFFHKKEGLNFKKHTKCVLKKRFFKNTFSIVAFKKVFFKKKGYFNLKKYDSKTNLQIRCVVQGVSISLSVAIKPIALCI